MAFRLRWSGTRAFLATEARVQFHEWLAVVTGGMVQGILVLFVAILAPGLLPIALIGAMVYSAFLIGQRLLSEAAYVRIDHKLNELYHASPMSPEAYFLGMAAGMLVAYLPTVAAFAVLFQALHPVGPAAWGMLIGALLAVWMISSTLGYVVSTLFRDMKTIWPYAALLANVFGVVPPVFYPLALVPAEWTWLALIVPTSAGTAVAGAATGVQPLEAPALLLAATALAVEAAAFLAFGIYWARRTAREA